MHVESQHADGAVLSGAPAGAPRATGVRLSSIVSWLLGAGLLLSLLLLTRPYAGIRHDSILYFGQALQALLPEQFSRDLFFEFGSQASFTLFPKLMGALLGSWSFGQVSMGLLITGLVGFLAASAFLVGKLVEPRLRYVALVLLVALPGGYGGHFVFSYAEAFATARSFGEPLALAALGFFLAASYVPAALLGLLALALHPLQALPALLVAWCWLVLKDRRWLHLAWLAVPVIALAALEVGPFAQLAQRFDAQWLQWILLPSPHVFLLHWPMVSWFQLFADLFVLALASRLLEGRGRDMARALLLAVPLGFVACLILVDLAQLVLPTGLQLWRIHWLAHWTAVVLTPSIVLHLWRQQTEASRARALFAAATTLLGAPAGPFTAAVATPITAALFVFWPRLMPHLTPAFRRVTQGAVVGAVVLAFLKFAVPMMIRSPARLETLALLLLHPVSLLALGAGAYLLLRRFPHVCASPVLQGAALAAVAALVTVAALQWDHRSPWSRYIESWSASAASPFGAELPAGAQVYWMGELLPPWLVLHRPSYWNGNQEAGLLFNRATAEEANRRSRVLGILELQGAVCNMVNSLERSNRCQPDDKLLADICTNAEGGLHYVVLPYQLAAKTMGSWQLPQLEGQENETVWMYSCGAGGGNADRRAAKQNGT